MLMLKIPLHYCVKEQMNCEILKTEKGNLLNF